MAKSTRIRETGKGEAIRVIGLNEIVASIAEVDPALTVNIRIANKGAATTVATGAKGAAASLGSTAAHVAPSIKASAGVKSGSVSLGGTDYPMAPGAEFGGGRRPTTHQFRPWLGHTGYFLYPTIRREHDAIDAEYRAALERALKEAGL